MGLAYPNSIIGDVFSLEVKECVMVCQLMEHSTASMYSTDLLNVTIVNYYI